MEEQRIENIKRITSLAELEGYEEAAKARGLMPGEVRAIHDQRKQLTPKKRGRK